MKNFSIIFALLTSINFIAQESKKSQKCNIDEFQVYSGFNRVRVFDNYKLSDMNTFVPSSISHNYNLTLQNKDKNNESIFFDDFQISTYLNASIAHVSRNPDFVWRIGINFINSTISLHEDIQNANESTDLIYGSNLNLISSKEAEERINTEINLRLNKYSIENSISFRTNQDKRWGIYAGFSGQLGFVQPNYNYKYVNSLNTYVVDSLSNRTLISSTYDSVNVTVRGRLNPYLSINALFGYDVRLSKKVHLFSEFKPGYCFVYVPELKAIRRTYNGFWSLVGLRFYLI